MLNFYAIKLLFLHWKRLRKEFSFFFVLFLQDKDENKKYF
ncbi:MAG: hypothetical protein FD155_906 [Bacteroidetes bacterium]|nr:MAG: hypothetical protein FD155_906 [Bacteroidota bacterium]